ncbi:hypothetical protein [Helicobacter bilis]|uniref:hypothetical protein n=1 Tax=Helicobacter bilis TaxID=37372 RepID=UPI00248F3E7F|nr:hypothetical protein [Helicobacter bilis]
MAAVPPPKRSVIGNSEALPLDCRCSFANPVRVKSGDFFGLRGERHDCEREGINPFLRKKESIEK